MTIFGMRLFEPKPAKAVPRLRRSFETPRPDRHETITVPYREYLNVLEALSKLQPVSVPDREVETEAFLRDWYLEETDAVAAAAEAIDSFVDGKVEPVVAEETLP